MNRIRRISLDILASTLRHAPIDLVCADVAAEEFVPLAVIRYSEDGKMQALGLRFDLDKRVFVDHLDYPTKDEFLNSIADDLAYEIYRLIPGHSAEAHMYISHIHNAIGMGRSFHGLHGKLGNLARIIPEDLYPELWKSLNDSWDNHKPHTALRAILDVLYDFTDHRLESSVEDDLEKHIRLEREGTEYF